jgi:hypothetical protein
MDKDKIKTIKRLVSDCRSGSKRKKKVLKGIDQCDVTFEGMTSLMEKWNWSCCKLGQQFHLTHIMGKRILEGDREALGINSLLLPSIDRIDNNKGYTMDNIQIVSMAYNQMKNIYSEESIMEWINAIKIR